MSSSSLEPAESIISTGSDDIDPFHDPSDTWYHDNLATPKASPQHHLIRSYSAASSRNSTPTTTDPLSVRRVLNLTASIPVSRCIASTVCVCVCVCVCVLIG